MSSNIDSITGGLEKDVSISIEEIASKLLSKVDIELKTDIPFHDPVWNTALLKSTADHIGILFRGVPLNFKLKNSKGETYEITYSEFLRSYYLKQIGYSEEYAVSEDREGRREIVSIAGRKFEEKRKHQDMLSAITGQ
jgi:hypothetical protein